MTREEKKKFEVLEALGLPALPDPVGPKTGIWFLAVAEVRLRSGAVSWVQVRNNPGHTPTVTRSFDQSVVAEFISIHPYKMCDESFLPKPGSKGLAGWVAAKYKATPEQVAAIPAEKLELLRQKYAVDEERRKIIASENAKKNLAAARAAKAAKAEKEQEK